MDRTIAHALVLLLALVATVGVFAGAAGEGSVPEPAARPTAEMGRFNEAPALASKVAAGELPPVDERLPIEPLVITPTEEIGQYGGTWHTLVGTSSETKWLNIYAYERLMRWDAEAKEVIPNIATSWTISQGGKVFTFQLREGMKWSDGHPFSADDIVFWYEDMVLNEELTPRFPGYLSVAGERGRVEKVDDYTVNFVFTRPNGLFYYYTPGGWDFLAPAHYLQQFHPKYTSREELDALVKEEGLEHWYQLLPRRNSYPLQNPDLPTLHAWTATTQPPSPQFRYQRNPYYWKIDTAGNQLPYIDEVVVDIVAGSEVLNLKTMAGESDLQAFRIGFSNYSLFMQNRDQGNYRVLLWPRTLGSDIALFPNINHNDPVLRNLIEDVRFRRALSLAINRDEINDLVYLGVGTPRQATVAETSPLFKEKYARSYAEYDADAANALLDEMGLTNRDRDGFRLRSDGQTLSLLIETAGEEIDWVDSLELVSKYWQAIGIKAAAKHEERGLIRSRVASGEAQVSTWALDRSYIPYEPLWHVPINGHTFWAPLNGIWYQTGGEGGQEPTGDVRQTQILYEQIKQSWDETARNELFDQLMELHHKNLWIIGLVGEVPQIVIAKNHMGNIPEKSLYSGTIGRFMGHARIEQYFIKE